MLKISKYYKPFIIPILFAIVLLFTQAMCDLKLPDYMSDIVNVGIQSNGIEQVTPKMISENGFEFIKFFMEEKDIEYTLERYTKVNAEDPEFAKKYSMNNSQNIYVLNENLGKEEIEKLDNIFAISGNTFINLMSKMSVGQNNTRESEIISTDLTKVYDLLPNLSMISKDVMNSAREEAKKTPESMLRSIGLTFTKAFYNEVNLDISQMQKEYIYTTGAKMMGVCIVGILSAIAVGFLGARIGSGIGRDIRKAVFEKVQSFGAVEFNNFSSASLITRTTNDVTQIQNVVTMMIRLLFFAPVMGIGSLVMMSQKTNELTWTIAVAIIAIICLIIFLFIFVMPKIKIVQKLTDKINLVAKENLSGLMVVRAFGTQKYEENRFDDINTEVMKTNRFINRSLGAMIPCMTLIMNGLNILIMWFGAKAIAESSIQVGDLMAVLQYGMHVVMSFLFVSMIFIMLPRASVSANRIVEVLETESTIKNPENPREFDDSKKGFVEFKDVSFCYPGANEKVLENISFVAKPGETTAFIGTTGSGKSTLVNLIPRLFDCTEGEVDVNGVNVKEVELDKLHDQIGFIPQKASLLSGTIESNLKYGNENANDEFVKKCSEIAQATEFIESKEEKYLAPISQGAKNISGGQKQRLSIARALVKNSPIYIFDDSFSALDFKTDRNLRNALKKHVTNATILIVAQRVSTIMDAEQIIVLEDGKIVGKGTHFELLKSCPTYFEIASSQLSETELNLE